MIRSHHLLLPGLVTLALSAAAAHAQTGSIRATVDTEATITGVQIVRTLYTAVGVEHTAHAATIDEHGLVTATDLPLGGRYALKFATDTGTVQGWDATVPESDYVEEWPLEAESVAIIHEKIGGKFGGSYDDQVILLDLQGNIQHAAALTTQLRRRGFVTGAGRVDNEWTWRVQRYEWHYPDEDTWVPDQRVPYYALVRRRLAPEDYKAVSVTYARHLGGIELTEDRPNVDLGTVIVPVPQPGIRAVNPDGSVIEPITLKPRPAAEEATEATDDDAG